MNETLTKLRETVALWYVREKTAADVVYAACDALVAGVDGPAMCMLAAASIHDAHEKMPPVLEAALREVGLPYHEPGSDSARQAGVLVMAERVLSGALAPRELTAWVHASCGHGKDDFTDRLARLDDLYDMGEYADRTPAEIDSEVRTVLRRVLEG